MKRTQAALKKLNLPGTVGDMLRRLILSWLLAVAVEYTALGPGLWNLSVPDGTAQMSFIGVAALTALCFLLLSGLSMFVKTVKAERWGIFAVLAYLGVLSVSSSFTVFFLLIMAALIAAALVFALKGRQADALIIPGAVEKSSAGRAIAIGAAVFFLIFASIWTVCKIYSFNTFSYDFGIFSQMFYSMRRTGLQLTTIERDKLMSHFHVHVSPIFYILLPFFYIFPYPATLQILQTAVLASSLFPLWKLGGQFGLSEKLRGGLCLAFFLFPTLWGGIYPDIHENCFLTPLLLWLFFFIERDNPAGIWISAALVLCVKEDAPIYIAVIALWIILKALLGGKDGRRRRIIRGAAMLALALLWFFLALRYLSRHGEGVMTNRYYNYFLGGSGSLLSVVAVVFTNPLKAVYECVRFDRIRYIYLTLLPLLALPLLTRRYENYLLLIPYILINLMPSYELQYNIYFQYSFGSMVFLFYLYTVNLSQLREERTKLRCLRASAALCFVFFCTSIVPIAAPHVSELIVNSEDCRQIREILYKIPDDASVAGSTFYTTLISDREELYDIRFGSEETCFGSDYIVTQPDSEFDFAKYTAEDGSGDGYDAFLTLLEEHGYEKVMGYKDRLELFKKAG